MLFIESGSLHRLWRLRFGPVRSRRFPPTRIVPESGATTPQINADYFQRAGISEPYRRDRFVQLLFRSGAVRDFGGLLAVTYVVKRREWASNVPIGQATHARIADATVTATRCSRAARRCGGLVLCALRVSPLTPAPCPQNHNRRTRQRGHRQVRPGILMTAAKVWLIKVEDGTAFVQCSALAVDARLPT